MTNYTSGHEAEKQAAEYLTQQGYKIMDLNWRTRLCEIDIVALKVGIIWLVEVKSRKSSNQGYGFDYITKTKLKQMVFAAEMWVQANHWEGDYRLAVVSVDGANVTVYDDI